jgi:hydrogenase nickel incorporation protein HypB
MCRDCGCSDPERLADLSHEHAHAHAEGAAHSHLHGHQHAAHAHSHHSNQDALPERTVEVQRALTELNDHLAQHNRERFSAAGVLALNLMSSPGAGKTRLLESTLGDLGNLWRMAAIVGDLATENDAERLRRTGVPIVPIATGTMCHLEADMIGRACADLDLASLDVLFIENVGNLVCPASFDLGEAVRVVLMSVVEGEDKPLKYPPMFKLADVVLLTKTDLVEAAGFDRDLAVENIRRVAPQAELIELSTRTGEGLQRWYGLLEQRILSQINERVALGTS